MNVYKLWSNTSPGSYSSVSQTFTGRSSFSNPYYVLRSAFRLGSQGGRYTVGINTFLLGGNKHTEVSATYVSNTINVNLKDNSTYFKSKNDVSKMNLDFENDFEVKFVWVSNPRGWNCLINNKNFFFLDNINLSDYSVRAYTINYYPTSVYNTIKSYGGNSFFFFNDSVISDKFLLDNKRGFYTEADFTDTNFLKTTPSLCNREASDNLDNEFFSIRFTNLPETKGGENKSDVFTEKEKAFRIYKAFRNNTSRIESIVIKVKLMDNFLENSYKLVQFWDVNSDKVRYEVGTSERYKGVRSLKFFSVVYNEKREEVENATLFKDVDPINFLRDNCLIMSFDDDSSTKSVRVNGHLISVCKIPYKVTSEFTFGTEYQLFIEDFKGFKRKNLKSLTDSSGVLGMQVADENNLFYIYNSLDYVQDMYGNYSTVTVDLSTAGLIADLFVVDSSNSVVRPNNGALIGVPNTSLAVKDTSFDIFDNSLVSCIDKFKKTLPNNLTNEQVIYIINSLGIYFGTSRESFRDEVSNLTFNLNGSSVRVHLKDVSLVFVQEDGSKNLFRQFLRRQSKYLIEDLRKGNVYLINLDRLRKSGLEREFAYLAVDCLDFRAINLTPEELLAYKNYKYNKGHSIRLKFHINQSV